MATFLANSVGLKVGTTDLSAFVSSITINQEFDQLEVTAMGDTGHKYIAGLENSSISIDFNADFVASAVNQTINGAVAGNGLVGTTASLTIVPFKGTTVSAANPLYTCTVLVTQWPQSYNIGELATVSVTWPVNGAVSKAVTGTF
jgi:hypothetical protein